MSSIGTGYHSQCKFCKKSIKGVRYDVCKTCRTAQAAQQVNTNSNSNATETNDMNATEEIKMPAKGDTVEVFGRPLTREDSVGKGKVLKITWDGTWYDGGIVATVTLKLKGDTRANTWALWVPQD